MHSFTSLTSIQKTVVYFIVSSVLILGSLLPMQTYAMTGTEAKTGIDDKQATIEELLKMIANLQTQLAELQWGQSQGTEPANFTKFEVSSCVELSQSMWLGSNDDSTNGQVSKLQRFLQSTGDYTYGELTGYYGPATLQAVQSWQRSHGVVSSGLPETTGYGIVGPATISAMKKGCESEKSSGTINEGSLDALPNNPTISGTAKGVSTVVISIMGMPEGGEVYRSDPIRVIGGKWSHRIGGEQPNTDYIAYLYSYPGNIPLSKANYLPTEYDPVPLYKTAKGMAENEIEEAEYFLNKARDAYDAVKAKQPSNEKEYLIESADARYDKAKVLFEQEEYESASEYAQLSKDFSERVLQSLQTTGASPMCSLVIDKKSYQLGDTINVTWKTTNTVYVRFNTDTSGKDNLTVPSGKFSPETNTEIAASVIGNPYIELEAIGKDGSIGTCRKVIPVFYPLPDYEEQTEAVFTADLISTNTSIEKNGVGVFVIKFEAAASGDDMILYKLNQPLVITDENGIEKGGTYTATLSSTADTSSDNAGQYYIIHEGDTEVFKLVTTYLPVISDSYQLQLKSLSAYPRTLTSKSVSLRVDGENVLAYKTNFLKLKGEVGVTDEPTLLVTSPLGGTNFRIGDLLKGTASLTNAPAGSRVCMTLVRNPDGANFAFPSRNFCKPVPAPYGDISVSLSETLKSDTGYNLTTGRYALQANLFSRNSERSSAGKDAPSLAGNTCEYFTITEKISTGAPTLTFTARPSERSAGKYRLEWSSTNATQCYYTEADTGVDLSGSDDYIVPSAPSQTYTITCTGSGGSVTKSVTINPQGTSTTAPTLNLTSSVPVVTSGGRYTISWTTTNATACSAPGGNLSDPYGTERRTSGSIPFSNYVVGPSTYTLTCTGPGGSVSRSVTVIVNPANTVTVPTISVLSPAEGATVCRNCSMTVRVRASAPGDEVISRYISFSLLGGQYAGPLYLGNDIQLLDGSFEGEFVYTIPSTMVSGFMQVGTPYQIEAKIVVQDNFGVRHYPARSGNFTVTSAVSQGNNDARLTNLANILTGMKQVLDGMKGN